MSETVSHTDDAASRRGGAEQVRRPGQLCGQTALHFSGFSLLNASWQHTQTALSTPKSTQPSSSSLTFSGGTQNKGWLKTRTLTVMDRDAARHPQTNGCNDASIDLASFAVSLRAGGAFFGSGWASPTAGTGPGLRNFPAQVWV
eukprot:3934946-Rhodomonas_salina.4